MGTTWRLRKLQGCNKLLWKTTTSSSHMEYKTVIEASCINNIHAGEKVFSSCYFWRFVSSFFSGIVKKLVYIWSAWVFFTYLEKRVANRYYLWEVYLVWCAKVWVYSEKQLSKKLAVFSSIFVADTKIFSEYNFVAPLKKSSTLANLLMEKPRKAPGEEKNLIKGPAYLLKNSLWDSKELVS